MQIVINIPEEMYTQFNVDRIYYPDDGKDLCVAVVKGTPLPKSHGRLIDADVMINKLCTHEASEFFGSVTCAEIMDFINDESPIIEVDKAESEGEE